MLLSDPVADMLTRIRNANQMRYNDVLIPASNFKTEIAKILVDEGFIKKFEFVQEGPIKMMKLHLKYGENNERVISGLKKVSRPGLRVYKKNNELPRVQSGLGIAIISTSKGLITDRQARKEEVGGEVIAYVW